jgi:hypothetical protein
MAHSVHPSFELQNPPARHPKIVSQDAQTPLEMKKPEEHFVQAPKLSHSKQSLSFC